jgi:thiol-disulfide isomerase/thioredoxin
MKKIFLSLFILIASYIQVNAKDGYSIKAKFTDQKDTMVYLCNYYGKASNVYRVDSAKLNSNGEVTFKSAKKIVGGIYSILFYDRTTNVEFILNNGDDLSFETTRSNIYQSIVFKGTSENIDFYDYQRFLVKYGAEYQKIEGQLVAAKNKKDTTAVYEKLKVKGKELQDYRENIIAKKPTSFLAKLFNAVSEPEIPTVLPTNPDGTKDSLYPRNFYKGHFWDKYDFRDDRLIYSPLYESKLENYMSKLVIPTPDSVEKECDMILQKAKGMEETFKYSLWYLTRWTETSKIMGMDEAFVYLVENYYMKGLAPWTDSAQLAKYVDRARKIAPNMIGQPAMDIRMMDTSGINVLPLSAVKANYTILIFWSPTCGHCQKEMPIFDSLYKAALKKYNVKIYAVEADGETDKWKKFISENKLGDGWVHVHDPNHTSNFRAFYDVYSTPTLYLLDENKVIRGKRIDHTNVLGLIEWLEKKKKTNK